MLRRLWQFILTKMATSEFLSRKMQANRSATNLAGRYVGGTTPQQAVKTAVELKNKGISSSLFYLGEYVDNAELVAENLAAILEVIPLLAAEKLDVHVSVDPTQLGSQLSWDMGAQNITQIAKFLNEFTENDGVHCTMLDMEDYDVNQATIDLHDQLAATGVPVALTLQAYLRKTLDDMRQKVKQGAKVRLVKGALLASADVAFTKNADIKQNYRRLIDIMFSLEAKQNGFYPIVATHDHRLHDYALQAARKNDWAKGDYEFEMLYGARNDVAEALARQGETIRLYLPFGSDWWAYAVRRVGENPDAAMLLLRSVFNK